MRIQRMEILKNINLYKIGSRVNKKRNLKI